jgi:hypothetical protein
VFWIFSAESSDKRKMKFINQNIALIISIALAYMIVSATGEYWPGWGYSLFGVSPDWSPTKYKFPIVILAFLILPIIRGLKNKFDL